ncbi:DUF1788 domain-containing protein [Clostridium cochlearium]|uniref:DUF1788 domain-containing protein n=1 Tax=Clostridium cochlearium TaxID=1494 RepID=UPI00156EF034|nr:DUF1788 domain-containing protein [Clostridium cochlearium]MBV1818928.1 DUF1788 domain-containing protein [Bacteroidales bacterium MSK.15.36]MCG4580749.1 DUF1788 domain-containing protein [Clostridium cochlearium]NSJ91316.1 DUF1788 domain-containing protein [Coprococcus sp. MSK.21.13]
MKTLEERLNQIEIEISKEDFRKNKGLGNEVGYYVFDYPAAAELRVREHIKYLKQKNNPSITGYELVIFDLYDLMLDYIEKEGLFEACIQMEEEHGLEYLISSIVELLNMDQNENFFTNYIEETTPNNAVVFITGVGKIFPFVRSHNILNKLHQVFDRVPVVLFYPGKYDGQTLMLFSEFKDDHYYRAFPLVR